MKRGSIRYKALPVMIRLSSTTTAPTATAATAAIIVQEADILLISVPQPGNGMNGASCHTRPMLAGAGYIVALREDFTEFCDRFNLDGVIKPIKASPDFVNAAGASTASPLCRHISRARSPKVPGLGDNPLQSLAAP
jgi:hypothetical protein